MSTPTILMIDNNPADVFLLKRAVELDKGIHVHSASTVEGAIGYLNSHPDPNLLVLDDVLDFGESGLELLEHLRRRESSFHAPAVLLSGLLSPDTEESAHQHGINCFEKPFELAGWHALAAQLAKLCLLPPSNS
jgi:CheY-like chemotaxis protein